MALESALEHAVENIMENDPEYAQCIAYARARMCQGYYPQYFVDGVVQKQRGKYTNEDAYVFITLWTDLWTNKLSVTKIYVGSGPSCDLARLDNQKKLDDGLAKVKLSYTRINSTGETFTSRTNAQFSARVDLHQRQGQDGALCWSKDMGVSLNDGTRTTPLINCSPLEIGYMNASTGLWGKRTREVGVRFERNNIIRIP
jgi:hypothetical protein